MNVCTCMWSKIDDHLIVSDRWCYGEAATNSRNHRQSNYRVNGYSDTKEYKSKLGQSRYTDWISAPLHTTSSTE